MKIALYNAKVYVERERFVEAVLVEDRKIKAIGTNEEILATTDIDEKIDCEGKTVIVDRYYPTTIAYNVALGMNYSWAKNVSKVVPLPDKIIYCSCDLETQLNRKQNKIDLIEAGFSHSTDKNRAFIMYQEKVRCVYEQLILESPSLYDVLNTEVPISECLKRIDNLLEGSKKYEKRK